MSSWSIPERSNSGSIIERLTLDGRFELRNELLRVRGKQNEPDDMEFSLLLECAMRRFRKERFGNIVADLSASASACARAYQFRKDVREKKLSGHSEVNELVIAAGTA